MNKNIILPSNQIFRYSSELTEKQIDAFNDALCICSRPRGCYFLGSGDEMLYMININCQVHQGIYCQKKDRHVIQSNKSKKERSHDF